jgi:hypothetical protein
MRHLFFLAEGDRFWQGCGRTGRVPRQRKAMQGKPKALRKTGKRVCVVFRWLVSGPLRYGTMLLSGYRGFGHCLRQMGGEVCLKWKQLKVWVSGVASVPGRVYGIRGNGSPIIQGGE